MRPPQVARGDGGVDGGAVAPGEVEAGRRLAREGRVLRRGRAQPAESGVIQRRFNVSGRARAFPKKQPRSEMIARPEISQNEWDTAEREVGNVARSSRPEPNNRNASEKDPMAKDLEIHEEMRDAMEDPDEKSQWAKMVKVREKMGKGPPVMLPYESKEKTDKLISSMSGAPYDPNTAISSHDWDKYEDPTKCAPNAY